MADQCQHLRLAAALRTIRDTEGKVCAGFSLCSHTSCASSYTAWVIAHEALTNMGDVLTAEERADVKELRSYCTTANKRYIGFRSLAIIDRLAPRPTTKESDV